MMKADIHHIRTDYMLKSLSEADVASDPFIQFTTWWKEALASDIYEVNAMTLATADASGKPMARIVLLKDYSNEGFVFFTNYNSIKGGHLAANPQACLLFFWKELERQVRIEGTVTRTSEADSDAYFHSRPEASRLGAWTSPQSQPIDNREYLEERFLQLQEDYKDQPIPRPPHWGGYIVQPTAIEFWQGRPSRLHDRIEYRKDGDMWKIRRLAP